MAPIAPPPAAMVSPLIAKLTGTRAAIKAVEKVVSLVGNNALTRNNPLERHYRDVLCARVHTPQDDSIIAAAAQSAFEGRTSSCPSSSSG
jgi:alkylation response protein AidB-like acyl-CoA dehydrogenase